ARQAALDEHRAAGHARGDATLLQPLAGEPGQDVADVGAQVAHDADDLDLEALGLGAGEDGQPVTPLPLLHFRERNRRLCTREHGCGEGRVRLGRGRRGRGRPGRRQRRQPENRQNPENPSSVRHTSLPSLAGAETAVVSAISRSAGNLPGRRTTSPSPRIATSVEGGPPGSTPPSTIIASSPASSSGSSAGSSTGSPPLRLALVAVNPWPSAASRSRSRSCAGTLTANSLSPAEAGSGWATGRITVSGAGQRAKRRFTILRSGSFPKSIPRLIPRGASCSGPATTTGSGLPRSRALMR